MQFRRIHDLPPYVFATVDQLKRELRRDGPRRDRPRLRQSGHPLAPDRGREARARPPPSPSTTATRRAAACPTCARRSASATRAISASRSTPTCTSSSTIGAKEGLAHLMWVLLEGGDSARRPEPELPDPPGRSAPRRRDRRPRAASTSDDLLGGIEEAMRAAQPAPARRDRLVPAQPDHRDRDARADAAARRPRPRARVRARARLRLRRHRLRRPRAALGARRRRRARLRGRAVQPDEVLLDGRLADGLHARPARRRRRAREAEVLPRLRHLPADPDRLDRRAARGSRLPGARSARSTSGAATRSSPGSAAPAGRSSRRKGTMFVWAPIPEQMARARLARVRARARARRRRRRQPRASASARAATATSASRSSRTSSGSARRRARSASCCRARLGHVDGPFRRRADTRPRTWRRRPAV